MCGGPPGGPFPLLVDGGPPPPREGGSHPPRDGEVWSPREKIGLSLWFRIPIWGLASRGVTRVVAGWLREALWGPFWGFKRFFRQV